MEQVQAGAHPEQVAETLGLHRKTVYGWVAKFRAGGWEALEAKPVPGRPSILTGDQLARLYSIIVGTDPRRLEFEFALWTRNMIREVIGREFRSPCPRSPSAGGSKRWDCPRRNPSTGISGRPGGRRAIEEFDVPEDPETGEEGEGDDLLHRRGIRAQRLPRRHHLAPAGRTPVVVATGPGSR